MYLLEYLRILSACLCESFHTQLLHDDLFSLNAFYVKVTELQSMDALTPPAYSPHANTTLHKENINTEIGKKRDVLRTLGSTVGTHIISTFLLQLL